MSDDHPSDQRDLTASEKAYATIRDLILTGGIDFGERLREQELADRIGVSRTPVREAVRRLGAEGLVDVEHHRGAVVQEFTTADLDEIFDLRALLEAYGAERAAICATPAELERLRSVAEEMAQVAESNDPDRLRVITELNNDFHEGVLQASGSARLLSIRYLVTQIPLIYRTFRMYSQSELSRSVVQHIELVEALENRDAAWASAVMRSHILAARHILIQRHDAIRSRPS